MELASSYIAPNPITQSKYKGSKFNMQRNTTQSSKIAPENYTEPSSTAKNNVFYKRIKSLINSFLK